MELTLGALTWLAPTVGCLVAAAAVRRLSVALIAALIWTVSLLLLVDDALDASAPSALGWDIVQAVLTVLATYPIFRRLRRWLGIDD